MTVEFNEQEISLEGERIQNGWVFEPCAEGSSKASFLVSSFIFIVMPFL